MNARPLRRAARRLGLAALLAALPGCYFSGSPPMVPYPTPEIAWAQVPVSGALGAPAATLRSPRLLVVSRFRSLMPNPVGGLFDRTVQNESPLWRTYYARYPEAAIFEGFSDRLREAGLDAVRDYTDAGNPRLLEAPLRARDPLLVTATVLRLRHDQLREAVNADFEAVFAVTEVAVRDDKGKALLTQKREVAIKVPAAGTNLLQLVGAVLADSLLRDAAFVKAIDGKVGG